MADPTPVEHEPKPGEANMHGAVLPVVPRVVVVGIPGLRWSDIDEKATPNLWRLAGQSALAAMSVRTALPTSCPLDGWLTLNSGARSIAPREDGGCADPPRVTQRDALALVPDWDRVLAANDGYSYAPPFGTLVGDMAYHEPPHLPPRPPATTGEVNMSGMAVGEVYTSSSEDCAVGRGGAVALALPNGVVDGRYAANLSALTGPCAGILAVDAGALPLGGARPDALAKADATVAEALDRAGPDATVLVAGLGDSDLDAAHLSVAMLREKDAKPGWLHAPSTRRDRLIQITDLTATALERMGEPKPDGVGSVLESKPRSEDTAAAVRELNQLDVAATVVRTNFVLFFVVLIAGQVLAYAAIGVTYLRGRRTRERAGRAVRAVALGFAAAPVSTFLVNLAPWPAAGHPDAALWAAIVATSAALGAIALAGPWRRRPFGPAGFLAALTVLVLAADVATGSTLQLNALFGLSPLVAGRFYGFGNVAYAVFAMCALVAAAWLGAEAARGDRQRGAAGALLVGAAAVAVDGWPDFGADFGGVIALLPGVAVLAAGIAGTRITPLRAAGVGAATAVVVAGIAVADWLRPEASRTHLGRFVEDVVDGEALDVVRRKADANLGLLVDAPVIVVVAVPLTVLVVLALARPAALRLTGLAEAQAREPVLRTLLVACVVTALIGFAANDSGIIVPAVALTAAGPLATALWAGIWSRTVQPDGAS